MPHYEQPIKRVPGSLKIVELFTTVQGEGERIGVASTFVRTGMCNLECSGCDTKWDAWTETSIPQVAAQVKLFEAKHVVISGGEPTLWQEDLAYLISLLPGYHITVESNGSVPITSNALLASVHLWSFSPKVGSLGHEEKFSHDVVLANIAKVPHGCVQLKYVLDPNVPEHVDSVFKFQERVDGLRTFYESVVDDDHIYFQPLDRGTLVNIYARQVAFNVHEEYNTDLKKLTELVLKRSHGRFRVLPQLHKYISYR